MGTGDDIVWMKESLWSDSCLYRTAVLLEEGEDSILIDKDRYRSDLQSGNIDGCIFAGEGNDQIVIRGNGLVWKSESQITTMTRTRLLQALLLIAVIV